MSDKWLGSKAGSGVFQAIIALMPPHDTYIELFAGSGAVLKRKPPAQQSYAVDLDERALALIPSAATRVKGDAFTFLDEFDYAGSGRTLIYADPRDLHSTRTSRNRYRHELDEAQHFALLQRLMLAPAQVILSGYPSQMYDSMLQGWRSREFQAMTRGGVRTEKLWFNFEPTAVHYATFAGKDYIDRQRIKRKAARWGRMFAALPPGERLAVLAGLLSLELTQTPPTLCDRPNQMRLTVRTEQTLATVSPASQAASTIGAGDDGETLSFGDENLQALSNSLQVTSNLR